MYYNSDKFLRDVFTLKNTTVFITDMVEYELSLLSTKQYQYLKNTMNKNNVKVVILKKDANNKLKIK